MWQNIPSDFFHNLKIAVAGHLMYREYLNQYKVICIYFLKAANDSSDDKEFITMVKDTIQDDVREAFSSVKFRKSGTAIQDLTAVTEQAVEKFILIMDE